MAVVYIHMKPHIEIFYVGVGVNEKRAFESSKTRRSKIWLNTVKKYPNYKVVIFKKDISYDKAKELERKLILYYGRKNIGTGILVNLTDGGDGTSGAVLSDEHKEKIRVSKIGENNPNFGKKLSKETCEKMSKSRSGENHYWFNKEVTQEFRDKMSKASKGKLIGGKHHQAVKVLNKETGVVYDTIKEVSELLGLKYTTLRAKLFNQNHNNTNYVLLKKGGSY